MDTARAAVEVTAAVDGEDSVAEEEEVSCLALGLSLAARVC